MTSGAATRHRHPAQGCGRQGLSPWPLGSQKHADQLPLPAGQAAAPCQPAARLLHAAEEGKPNPSWRPTHLIRAFAAPRQQGALTAPAERRCAQRGARGDGARPCWQAWPCLHLTWRGGRAAFSTFLPALSHRHLRCQKPLPAPGRAGSLCRLQQPRVAPCKAMGACPCADPLGCPPLPQGWVSHPGPQQRRASAPALPRESFGTGGPALRREPGSTPPCPLRPKQPGEGVCVLRHRYGPQHPGSGRRTWPR